MQIYTHVAMYINMHTQYTKKCILYTYSTYTNIYIYLHIPNTENEEFFIW